MDNSVINRDWFITSGPAHKRIRVKISNVDRYFSRHKDTERPSIVFAYIKGLGVFERECHYDSVTDRDVDLARLDKLLGIEGIEGIEGGE